MKGISKFIILLLFITGSMTILKAQYTNPVGNFAVDEDTADPSVLQYDGKYYLYATSRATHTYGYKVWESVDLVHWEDKGDVFRNDWTGNEWGKENYWAPEVIYYNGYFYMVYSARADDNKLHVALAKSSSPLGPFINVYAPFLDASLECIDGHLFIDDDGTPYLFYSKDVASNIVDGYHVSQTFVQKLVPNYLMPMGDPVLAVEPVQEWELVSGDWQWNEGPHLIKHNDTYYLMYSGNAFFMPEYAIGCATADNPMGPYTKYDDNPVLQGNPSIGATGTGHHSITYSPDKSEMFIVYHTHRIPEDPYAGREICIDRVVFDDNGKLSIIGPTRSPQPMPSNITNSLNTNSSTIQNDFFKLDSIYPNPFNNTTNITFTLLQTQEILLTIYDIKGNEIRQLFNGSKAPGQHTLYWDGKNEKGNMLSSGMYIVKLFNGNNVQNQKVLMLK